MHLKPQPWQQIATVLLSLCECCLHAKLRQQVAALFSSLQPNPPRKDVLLGVRLDMPTVRLRLWRSL